MLKRKNLLLLAGVLLVLVVVSVLQERSHEQATSRASSEVLLPGTFASADLDRLVLAHGGETAVEMVAGPDGWRLASAWNARMNEQRLDGLLRSLSGLRGEFRSDAAAVVPDYGFTDSTTITITGHDAGGEVLAIEVGGKPEGGQGNFVKRPGSDTVYLTQTNLLSNLGLWTGPERPSSRHFLDLQALREDEADIEAITLATPDGTLRLVKEFAMVEPAPDDTARSEPYEDRDTWEWRLEDGDGDLVGMAVKTRADAVLGAATSLRAQDVADPTVDLASYGLEPPARTATLLAADGTETVIRLGDERAAEGEAPGGFYTRVGDDPTIWVLGTFNADNIFKSREDLLPEE